MRHLVLQPVYIPTAADPSHCIKTVHDVLPQWNPISPTLSNIYLDKLAEKLTVTLQRNPEQQTGKLFAEDTGLHLKNASGLKEGLGVYDEWAGEHGVVCSATNYKIVAPAQTKDAPETFQLGGEQLESVSQTKYLGMMLSAQGFQTDLMSTRADPAMRLFWALITARQITQ